MKNKSEGMPILKGGEVVSNEVMYQFSKYLYTNQLVKFDSVDYIFLALQIAFSLGMKSMGDMLLAINNMYFVKGRVGIWGDLPMAIVQNSGKLEFIEEFFIDKDYKKISLDNKNLQEPPICAVCRVKRKGHEIKEFYLTLKDLALSGNYSEKDASFRGRGDMKIWNNYPKIMWAKRLKRWSIANVFSDVLKCVSVDEDSGGDKKVYNDDKDIKEEASNLINVYSGEEKKDEEDKEEKEVVAESPKIEAEEEEQKEEPEKQLGLGEANKMAEAYDSK